FVEDGTWQDIPVDWGMHCHCLQMPSSVEIGHGRMSKSIGVCIAIGCRTPFQWRMVMAVYLKLSGVCIAIGCRTPFRWRMVMAVYLNRVAYALQLDAEHLFSGGWSWLYISN